MEAQTIKSPRALPWIAAIAAIVLCGAGAGAVMGWLPASTGRGADPAKSLSGAEQPKAPSKVAAAQCVECGVVDSVREIESDGAGDFGVRGAAQGLPAIPIGEGKKIAATTSAPGGVAAGNRIEWHAKKIVGYEVTVRFEDGSTRAFTEEAAPGWRSGDKVKIVNGRIESNA